VVVVVGDGASVVVVVVVGDGASVVDVVVGTTTVDVVVVVGLVVDVVVVGVGFTVVVVAGFVVVVGLVVVVVGLVVVVVGSVVVVVGVGINVVVVVGATVVVVGVGANVNWNSADPAPRLTPKPRCVTGPWGIRKLARPAHKPVTVTRTGPGARGMNASSATPSAPVVVLAQPNETCDAGDELSVFNKR